jgi:2-polyprenyl-6-hydroxyphenyl methylase/3-demethylubiquinone-9 3-methyltransferase
MAEPTTHHHDNYDPDEVGKFDDLASRWWDPDGEFKPLHQMNPLRLDYIDRRAPIEGKRCLDVGCGGGILSESLAANADSVTGIDFAGAALEVARLHLKVTGLDNVRYLEVSADAIAEEEPAGYDIVTCLEVLEHVPDPAQLIDACARLVKPSGDVFLSTINRNPKSFAMAIVGAEYVLKLLPRGTHDYDKFIQPAELDDWGRRAGLALQDLTGMQYNPFSESFRLGGSVDVNYLAHFRPK